MKLLGILVALVATANAQELKVVGYNAESGGATEAGVAARIGKAQDVDIWGLCEVKSDWADGFEAAAEVGEKNPDGSQSDYKRVLGTTGGADRLLIVYDSDRLEILSNQELTHINVGGRVRAPLVARFKLKGTNQEFFFMVNHLYRSKASKRHLQATLLNDWARAQSIPTIAVGDYNFDWEVVGGDQDHDDGFDNMIADAHFKWVRPATLIKTQASPRYNSVLDFVFVAGAARNWTATSTILVAPNDFPDDHTTSDHRPVKATLQLGASGAQATNVKATLLARIEALKREIAEIKALVESIPD